MNDYMHLGPVCLYKVFVFSYFSLRKVVVGDSEAGVLAYYIPGGLSCRRIFAEIEE
jgi:hypothetical protein